MKQYLFITLGDEIRVDSTLDPNVPLPTTGDVSEGYPITRPCPCYILLSGMTCQLFIVIFMR